MSRERTGGARKRVIEDAGLRPTRGRTPGRPAVAARGEGAGGPADRRVLNALRRIVHAVDLHSRQLVQLCNITAPQLVCLHTLAEEGPLTSRRLAERVHVNPSTLVGIVDRLERKGLIQRRRDLQDRRSVSLALTDEGQGFVRQSPSPLQATLMVSLRQMQQEEQERLAGALEEVVEMMEAEELPPIPLTALPRYATGKEGNSH